MLIDVANEKFPWDELQKYKKSVKYDLSVGSPKDDVSPKVKEVLASFSNAHSYPTTIGLTQLQDSIIKWLKNVRKIDNVQPKNIVPTIGSKEAVALLPQMLGIGKNPQDIIVRPKYAYPTYDIGAKICNVKTIATDNIGDWAGNKNVKLIWLNSPNNPTGEIFSDQYFKDVVSEARKIGAYVVSDECYAMFDFRDDLKTNRVASVLNKDVCGGDFTNLLMLYSLSKASNLAGYRASFIAGDEILIKSILQIRKHVGMMVPTPIQGAFACALDDVDFTKMIVEKYFNRYQILKDAFLKNNYQVEKSEGGLYLWVKTKRGNCFDELDYFAEKSILFAPGLFYSDDADKYIRVSLTCTDEECQEVANLL